MGSLFKVALIASGVLSALNLPVALAAEQIKSKTEVTSSADAGNDMKAVSYAMGASLARYVNNIVEEQEKLGFKVEKAELITGLQDQLNKKSKFSDDQIEKTLSAFEVRAQEAAEARREKESKENIEKGTAFAEKFSKEKGVKKTQSGLLYLIEKEGAGEAPKEGDLLKVNYKGTFVDGKEFDSSYSRKEPAEFRLDGVIAGWKEGLKLVKKGGKIKLVIPADLAYGPAGTPSIPPNSTLVFEVELIDIVAADAKPAEAAK